MHPVDGSHDPGSPAVDRGDAPTILPRHTWGKDLPPVGPLTAERPEDVRFLLIHHTAGSNDYRPEQVISILRGIYDMHTREKTWPDVAYNFFVDRFGGIWEGRAGSRNAAIRGDSTGGHVGGSVLCCFVGHHQEEPPAEPALAAMSRLLAWLCRRHQIDPSPGATVTFVSRGSNRWPPGASLTVRTIAGHRDVSRTVCPGDQVYRMLERDLPDRVAALLPLGSSGGIDPPSGAC